MFRETDGTWDNGTHMRGQVNMLRETDGTWDNDDTHATRSRVALLRRLRRPRARVHCSRPAVPVHVDP
eukprot:7282908-Prymnesium_polylepis.2